MGFSEIFRPVLRRKNRTGTFTQLQRLMLPAGRAPSEPVATLPSLLSHSILLPHDARMNGTGLS